MENTEEVYHCLEEFSKRKIKVIPQVLNDYLAHVAITGDPIYQWSQVRWLFREKLLSVITEFHDSNPGVDIPPCPNVDSFNYQTMKNSLLERLDSFTSAPFTVQRICELLTQPRKQYNRVDKFMRAIEKNILVVSTREPGFIIVDDNGDSSDTVILNGSDNSDYHLDVEMEDVSWKDRDRHSEPQPSSSSAHSSSNKDSKHQSRHHRDSKDSPRLPPLKHFPPKIVRDHKRIERIHVTHDSPRREAKKGDKSIDVSTIPLPGAIPSMPPSDGEIKLEYVKKPIPIPEVKLERLEHIRKKSKDETKEIKTGGENVKKEKEARDGELKEVHKKEEHKKVELKKLELKTDELKKEQLKKDVLKKEEFKKEQLRKKELKKEQLKKEELKKEEIKKEELKEEQLEEEELKKEELIKEELIKEELIKEELIKEELIKEELIKNELMKEELEEEEHKKEELKQKELKQKELKKEEIEKEELKKEKLRKEELKKYELIKAELLRDELRDEEDYEEVLEEEVKQKEKEDVKENEENKMSEDDSLDESSSDSNSKEDAEMKMISEASTSSEESSSSEGSSPKTDNEAQAAQEDEGEKPEVIEVNKAESDPLKETPPMEPIKPKLSLPVSIETDKYTISDVKSELAEPSPPTLQEKDAPENNEEANKPVKKITEAGDCETMDADAKSVSPVMSKEKKDI